jgi:hypothetical protein
VLVCVQSLEGLTIQARLDEMRLRYKVDKGNTKKIMRNGRIKLSQAERKLWETADWTQVDHIKVSTAAHTFKPNNKSGKV